MDARRVAEQYFVFEDNIVDTEHKIGLTRAVFSIIALLALVAGVGVAGLKLLSNFTTGVTAASSYMYAVAALVVFAIFAFGVPLVTRGWHNRIRGYKASIANVLTDFAEQEYGTALSDDERNKLAVDPFAPVMGVRAADHRVSSVRFTVFQDRMVLLASEVEV